MGSEIKKEDGLNPEIRVNQDPGNENCDNNSGSLIRRPRKKKRVV